MYKNIASEHLERSPWMLKYITLYPLMFNMSQVLKMLHTNSPSGSYDRYFEDGNVFKQKCAGEHALRCETLKQVSCRK